MTFDDRLFELYIDLPEPPSAEKATAHAVKAGKLLFVAGVLPRSEGKMMKGRVGVDVTLDKAKLAARAALVNAFGIMAQELGGTLNKIKRIVKLSGAVACGADFKDHFKVLDSASELLKDVFGNQGKHVREVIGASSLPEGAVVELSLVVELK
jgi:enamine deaminase RidA (YjgF/YER057c/UK114 family)